jgi:hypothetical protein
MSCQKVYKPILESLMSSVHRLEAGHHYESDRVYTDAEKRQVNPEEMMRWLNNRAFGVPVRDPDVFIKPLLRSSNRRHYTGGLGTHLG